MLIDAKLDPEYILTDWLLNYRSGGAPMMPLPVKDHLGLFKEMFSDSVHNMDECLEDWGKNYQVKTTRVRKEKLSPKQTAIMEKINSFPDKAFGIGLK